jgi:hypothetical protein
MFTGGNCCAACLDDHLALRAVREPRLEQVTGDEGLLRSRVERGHDRAVRHQRTPLPQPTGALRRSEFVALNVQDLEFDASRGLVIVIRGSKTPPAAGRNPRGGAVRAREKQMRSPRGPDLAASRHPPLRGLPTDPPQRHAH